jgi:hypothetical protein
MTRSEMFRRAFSDDPRASGVSLARSANGEVLLVERAADG